MADLPQEKGGALGTRAERTIARATVAILLATVVSVIVAVLQLIEVTRNDEATARAWIGSPDANIYTKGQRVGVAVQYQNFGRDPATNVSRTLHYDVYNAGDDELVEEHRSAGIASDCLKTDTSTEVVGNVVFPNQRRDVNLDFKPADIPAIRSGTKFVLAHPCFTYRSGGRAHHTAACYFFRSGRSDIGSIGACREGNIAD